MIQPAVVRDEIGLTGILGLVLGLIAVIVFLAVLRPAIADNNRLVLELSTLRKRGGSNARPVALSVQIPAAESQFPVLRDVSGIFKDIMDGATQAALPVSNAEYTWTAPKEISPGQYEMSVRLTGGYVKIRRWLQTVLNQHPAVALRAINFSRDPSARQFVTANLRLVVFVRPDNP